MESPDLVTGVSALSELQRSHFWRGYIYPSPYLWRASSPKLEDTIGVSSSSNSDLPIPPPKLVDLRRIEGEALDLQLHQAVLHFPLIHLRDSILGFPLGKPRNLVVLNLAATFVWQIVGAWEPPTLLWVAPQACCKGSGFRLEGF